MQAVQANRIRAFRAARRFLDDNGHRLPGINDTGMRRRFDEAHAEIDRLVADQRGLTLLAEGETARYQDLRRTLVQSHMAIIAAVSQGAAEDTSGLAVMTLPRGNPSPMKLAAAARGMAMAAAAHAQVFKKWGAHPDFVKRLNDAADAMLASHGARTQLLARRSGTTAALAKRLSEARLILDALASFMYTMVHRDPELLAGWSTATAVRSVARRTATAPVLRPVAVVEQLALPPAPAMKLLTSGAESPPLAVTQRAGVLEVLLAPFRRKAG